MISLSSVSIESVRSEHDFVSMMNNCGTEYTLSFDRIKFLYNNKVYVYDYQGNRKKDEEFRIYPLN